MDALVNGEGRSAKVARLQRLQGLGVNSACLLQGLKELRCAPETLDAAPSRRHLDHATHDIYNEVSEQVVLTLDAGADST